jgi:hypothetical protein
MLSRLRENPVVRRTDWSAPTLFTMGTSYVTLTTIASDCKYAYIRIKSASAETADRAYPIIAWGGTATGATTAHTRTNYPYLSGASTGGGQAAGELLLGPLAPGDVVRVGVPSNASWANAYIAFKTEEYL